MTTFLKHKDNAIGYLSEDITAGDLTITLMAGEGAKFPTSGNFEIICENEKMLCTARTDDVLTVTRGIKSTAAADHALGKSVELRVISQHLEDIEAAITTLEGLISSYVTLTGEQTLANKTLTTPVIGSFINAQHSHTDAAGGGTISVPSGTPTGVIEAYGGSVAPSGYMLCDGSAISRATYSALFAVLSTTYGAGDGSTTFNLPDLRGRVPMGVDGTAARITANDALGNSSGAESVSHSHTMKNHTHNANHGHTAWTDAGGSHAHNVGHTGNSVYSGNDSTPAYLAASRYAGHSCDTQGSHSHGTGVNGNNFNTGGPSDNTSDASSPSVLQPYQVVNYIIKL